MFGRVPKPWEALFPDGSHQNTSTVIRRQKPTTAETPSRWKPPEDPSKSAEKRWVFWGGRNSTIHLTVSSSRGNSVATMGINPGKSVKSWCLQWWTRLEVIVTSYPRFVQVDHKRNRANSPKNPNLNHPKLGESPDFWNDSDSLKTSHQSELSKTADCIFDCLTSRGE